jgi:hypothetical protein
MKLIPAIAVVCLTALFDLDFAFAKCANDDPATVAKRFYSQHANFPSGNPAKLRPIITPRLFAALEREYKCSKGKVCALDADPWIDAQDGDIGNPVEFLTIRNTGTQSAVRMTYPCLMDETHQRQQHVTLILQRRSPAECWLFGDLITPRGESVVESIEKWHEEFRRGL